MDFKTKVKIQRGYRRAWHNYRKREIMERTDETVKDTDVVDYKILDMLRFLFINGRCLIASSFHLAYAHATSR